MRSIVLNFIFAATLSICAVFSNAFAEENYIEIFGRSAEDSSIVVEHSDWNRLLGQYVEDRDGVNLFRYGSVTVADRELLERYLDKLASIAVANLNRDEQFAYWVNLYNALTVKVILDHYPVESIKDISYSLLAWGPWKEPLIAVEGVALSLDDIEHEILRPVFGDTRIH